MSTHRVALVLTHHGEHLAEVVRTVACPLAARLRESTVATHVYLRRHWKHGPHVRVIACGADRRALTDLLTTTVGEAQERLTAIAPGKLLDHDSYLSLSEVLGKAELVPGPYEPLWPDHHVTVLDETTGDSFIDNPRSAALRDELADGFARLLPDIPSTEGRGRSNSLTSVFSLMALLAATYPDGGLKHGFLSFKSHLEDFLFDNDADGRMRAQLDLQYGRHAQALRELTDALVPDPHQPSYARPDQPVLAGWSKLVESGWRSCLRGAEEGAIIPLLHPGYLERAAQLNSDLERKYRVADDRSYSEFHQRLRGFDFTDPEGGRWFAGYRFLVNFLYSQLPLLNVSPMERMFLSHALSETTQSLTGVTWQQIFDTEVTP